MQKVIVDKKIIKEVVERGVEQVFPSSDQLFQKLTSGERLKLYCGFDPTAPALHIGHAILLNKLGQFQALGHEVIFLIGDFTGLIGDPTDKKAVRKQLTREDIMVNVRDYKRQASAFLQFEGDNAAQVLYNSSWNAKLNLSDVISLATNFTVQQMIQRDMFQARLKEEKAIYLHEFLYPLIQAHDSVFMDVDLEIGGNDQMFNMMCGRSLLKSLKNKEKFVMTMKLLSDDNGKKMGKSEGNAVFLDATPEDMYGRIMSWSDGVIASAFELCTKLPLTDIAEITRSLEAGDNPRDHKARLAWEITKTSHGQEAANQAQDAFVRTFQKKDVPDNLPTWPAKQAEYTLIDLLVATNLVSSKTEARRLIKEGAIKTKQADDFEVASSEEQVLKVTSDIIISRGKRQFVKVIHA